MPRRLRSSQRGSRTATFFREAALVNMAILLYFAVRNVTAGNPEVAFANAERLMHLERTLSLAWENRVQEAIGASHLVTVANWVYIWGHWPVIVSTGVALFVLRPDRYLLLRNAMFVSGAIGFAFFAFFPVAPPRLLDLGLVDTVTEQSGSYRALQPPGLTNQYAAFPSLHVGWNVLVGVVLFGTTANVAVRAFAVLTPLAMAVAVVATANHFVVDLAGGVAVVAIGLAAAISIERSHTRAALPSSAGPLVPYHRSARFDRHGMRRRATVGRRPHPASRRRARRAPVRRA